MALSLKAARVNAGLTQAEMAERLDVAPVTIWKWETGKSEPKVNQFKRFCEVCGLKMDDIFLPDS